MKELSLIPSKLLFVFAVISCFLIILQGTSAYKYIIYVLSFISIICTYNTSKFSSLLPELKKITLPWLPWVVCTITLMLIHGTKGLTKFPNAFLILCLLFVALSTLKIKRENLILCLSVGLFVLNVAISLFLYKYGLGNNIFEVNRNPLLATITILNTTILSTVLLNRETYSKTRFLFILLTVLFTLITTILAQTRHVLLAYPACALVFLLFASKETKRISLYFLLIFVLMLVCFLLTGRLQQGVTDLVQYSHGNTNSSWGLRLEMWKWAILTFPESPIYGWGDNAAEAMEKAGIVPPLKEWFIAHFHNDFLNALTMGGLVMAGGWVTTIICLIKNSYKDLPRLCSLASILAAGLVDRDWFDQDVLFPFVILWTLFYLTDPARKENSI